MPPAEKLEALVSGFFGSYDQFPNLAHAFLSVFVGVDEEVRHRLVAEFAGLYGRFNDLLADLFEQGKVAGQIRPDLDSPIAAAAMVVLLDAMYLQVAFGLVENDPARLATSILDLLGRGYRRPEGDPR